MANEFKIKKGLIVTGASGGTVVDIQGSQGQLFSVTDNLSGSIFAVSDISGVPIFDVNSSGLSTFDGLVSGITPVNAANFVTKAYVDGSGGGTGPFLPLAGGTLTGTLISTENQGSASIYINSSRPSLGFTDTNSFPDPNDIYLIRGTSGAKLVFQFYDDSSSTATETFSIDPQGNSVFQNTLVAKGNITSQTTGGAGLNLRRDDTSISGTNTLGYILFQGDDPTDGTFNNGAAIFGKADGSWSSGAYPGQLLLQTRNTTGGLVTALTLAKDQNATFSTQAFATTATSSGDASSTLTTKGYVDGLITGATIYRGAWDPSGGGYGSPDLSGVTQTSGYYYICSAAGTAEPNGTGTEPDTWAVGDWVIYNDVSGTGQWQKIDNSSVLSGVGTGQTVALWEGAGSVTDSETLGNAPITVSGNNTTFAGTVNADLGIVASGAMSTFETTLTNNDDWQNSPISILERGNVQGTQTADKYAPNLNFHWGAKFSASLWMSVNGHLHYGTYGSTGIPTSDGTINAATFSGDHLGTINTATTGVTQTAGDNSTLIATTAYADAAAAAVPIGNYLPLAGGTMTGVTQFNDHTNYGDQVYARFGASQDLQIFHNGTDSFIDNYTGSLTIRNRQDDGNIVFTCDDGSGGLASYLTLNGNSTHAYFTNPGNVGIGTTNPGSKLELSEVSGGAPTLLTLHQTAVDIVADDSMGSFIDFKSTDINANFTPQARIGMLIRDSSGDSGVQSEGCGNLVFHTSRGTDASGGGVDVERMRITDIGNVGIGTSTPNAKLDVQGTQGQLFSVTDDLSGDIFSVADISGVPIMNVNSDGTSYFDGNVGIGTTSPYTQLQVGDSEQTTSAVITIASRYGGSNPYLNFRSGHPANSNVWNMASIHGDDDGNYNGKLEFRTANSGMAAPTIKMIIKASGNVGIGTTSPSAKLEVAGQTVINSTGLTEGFQWFNDANEIFSLEDTSGAGELLLLSSNSVKVVLNANGDSYLNGGNVGIGTTSPDTLLNLASGERGSNAPTVRITNTFTADDWSGDTSDLGRFEFFTEDTSGNGPYILGKISIKNDQTVGTPTLPSGAMVFGTTTYNAPGGSTERMRITSSGRVGIGTSLPATTLQVNGLISADQGAGNGYTFVGDLDTSIERPAQNTIILKTAGSERLRVNSSGNVGINVTNPNARLNVNGGIKIEGTGSLSFGGSASVPSWAINSSGSDLIIDDQATTSGSVLFNNNEGVALPRLTTTQINAISSPTQGLMAYNTTLNTICFFNGWSWQKVSHANM